MVVRRLGRLNKQMVACTARIVGTWARTGSRTEPRTFNGLCRSNRRVMTDGASPPLCLFKGAQQDQGANHRDTLDPRGVFPFLLRRVVKNEEGGVAWT